MEKLIFNPKATNLEVHFTIHIENFKKLTWGFHSNSTYVSLHIYNDEVKINYNRFGEKLTRKLELNDKIKNDILVLVNKGHLLFKEDNSSNNNGDGEPWIIKEEDPKKPEFTASDFMDFFNDNEKLNQISESDRIDIFLNVLTGSSDITVKLLNQLLRNYDVCDIEVSRINY